MLVAIVVVCFVITIWVCSLIIDLNVQFNCCHFDVQLYHCHFDVQFSHCHFDVQFNQSHFIYSSVIVILSYLRMHLLLTKKIFSLHILPNAMYATTSIQTHFDMKHSTMVDAKHNTLHPILGQHYIK